MQGLLKTLPDLALNKIVFWYDYLGVKMFEKVRLPVFGIQELNKTS